MTASCPKSRTEAGVSRREFVGLVAAGLAVSVLPGGGRAMVTASGRAGPETGTAARAGAGPWLEREYLGAELASHPVCWHCVSRGASLELTAGGVWLDEPGWGRHRFPLAAFREGYPQETVRRIFGPTVAEELCLSVEAILRR